MVVGSCCGKADSIGIIRTVIAVDGFGSSCSYCKTTHHERVAHISSEPCLGGLPVRWLKKIDPLQETEDTREADKVTV
jgi:hypothetical protein